MVICSGSHRKLIQTVMIALKKKMLGKGLGNARRVVRVLLNITVMESLPKIRPDVRDLHKLHGQPLDIWGESVPSRRKGTANAKAQRQGLSWSVRENARRLKRRQGR